MPDGKTTWKRPTADTAASKPAPKTSGDSVRQVSIKSEKAETSDDEDEEEEEGAGANDKFPSWTRSEWLVPKLTEQVSLDGDAIFGQAVHRRDEAVDLGDIFGRRDNGHRYHRRTSSAHWNTDRLMSPEEKDYKKRMGYKN